MIISFVPTVLFDMKLSYRVNSIILITEHIISVVRRYITRAELIIVIITISVYVLGHTEKVKTTKG